MKSFRLTISFLFFLILTSVLPSMARASCAFSEMKNPQDYKILKTWSITHESDKHPTGCLAKIGQDKKETLIYTPYEFICKTPPDQTISLSLMPSCCDAGRQGDYPCGIMPKGLAGKLNNMQASLTAVPGQPDARVVSELAEKLIGRVKNREMSGIRSLSDKLAEYAANPQFSELVEKYSADLKQAFDESSTPWARSAIATVLIALNPKGLNDENLDIDLLLSFLEDTISRLDDRKIAVLKILQERPRKPEKSLPVLVNVLGDVYDDQDLIIIMQTIRSFGPDSSSYLQQVYDRIKRLPGDHGNHGQPPPESLVLAWRDMVCFAYDSDAAGKTDPSVECTP